MAVAAIEGDGKKRVEQCKMFFSIPIDKSDGWSQQKKKLSIAVKVIGAWEIEIPWHDLMGYTKIDLTWAVGAFWLLSSACCMVCCY